MLCLGGHRSGIAFTSMYYNVFCQALAALTRHLKKVACLEDTINREMQDVLVPPAVTVRSGFVADASDVVSKTSSASRSSPSGMPA